MPFRVSHTEVFAGKSTWDFDTLDKALDYVDAYSFRYDDVEVCEIRHLDVYTLMSERKVRRDRGN